MADHRHCPSQLARRFGTVDAVNLTGLGNPDQPCAGRVEDRGAVQLGNGDPGRQETVGRRVLHRFDIASIQRRFQRAFCPGGRVRGRAQAGSGLTASILPASGFSGIDGAIPGQPLTRAPDTIPDRT